MTRPNRRELSDSANHLWRSWARLARRLGLLVGAVTMAASNSAAQSPSAVAGHLRVSRSVQENFLQAPATAPQLDVWSNRIEFRIEERTGTPRRAKGHARLEWVQYQQFGNSPTMVAGFGRDGPTHSYEAAGTFQWNRPRVETSDLPERANAVGVTSRYGWRFVRAVEVMAIGGYRREYTEPLVARPAPLGSRPVEEPPSGADGNVWEVGSGARVRGFGSAFSPEVGFVRSWRRMELAREDYREDSTYVLVRSSIGWRVSINARYRHRLRYYETPEQGTANYGRQDWRDQATGSVDLGLTRHVYLVVSGWLERGRSSRAGRDFETTLLESGLALRF